MYFRHNVLEVEKFSNFCTNFQTLIVNLGKVDSCFYHCPGFGFFSSSWYSVVFWIHYEKNVDKTLMFSVVAE